MVDNKYAIGVDIGGTFTDIAAITNNGKLLTWKIPSTPPSFADAVSSGIIELFEDKDTELNSGAVVSI